MAGITQSDVMNRLVNLRGMPTMPNGANEDYKRYIQDSFNYAWRYYAWTFSKKTATIDLTSDAHLPSDFDLEGWRQVAPASLSQQWTELTQEDYVINTGAFAWTLTWDFNTSTYLVTANNGPKMTFTYQVEPPTLNDTTKCPFPDAMTIAVGAAIWAKYGANPTSADAQQQWDIFHAMLDRISAQADRNRPRSRVFNLYDVHGTYPGDTR